MSLAVTSSYPSANAGIQGDISNMKNHKISSFTTVVKHIESTIHHALFYKESSSEPGSLSSLLQDLFDHFLVLTVP